MTRLKPSADASLFRLLKRVEVCREGESRVHALDAASHTLVASCRQSSSLFNKFGVKKVLAAGGRAPCRSHTRARRWTCTRSRRPTTCRCTPRPCATWPCRRAAWRSPPRSTARSASARCSPTASWPGAVLVVPVPVGPPHLRLWCRWGVARRAWACAFNAQRDTQLFVATQDGRVSLYDSRMLFSGAGAHDGAPERGLVADLCHARRPVFALHWLSPTPRWRLISSAQRPSIRTVAPLTAWPPPGCSSPRSTPACLCSPTATASTALRRCPSTRVCHFVCLRIFGTLVRLVRPPLLVVGEHRVGPPAALVRPVGGQAADDGARGAPPPLPVACVLGSTAARVQLYALAPGPLGGLRCERVLSCLGSARQTVLCRNLLAVGAGSVAYTLEESSGAVSGAFASSPCALAPRRWSPGTWAGRAPSSARWSTQPPAAPSTKSASARRTCSASRPAATWTSAKSQLPADFSPCHLYHICIVTFYT